MPTPHIWLTVRLWLRVRIGADGDGKHRERVGSVRAVGAVQRHVGGGRDPARVVDRGPDDGVADGGRSRPTGGSRAARLAARAAVSGTALSGASTVYVAPVHS